METQDAIAEIVRGRLTPREWEVLQVLAAQSSNEHIADVCGISRNTVKFHLANIYGKLGVGTRAGAADCFRRIQGMSGASN